MQTITIGVIVLESTLCSTALGIGDIAMIYNQFCKSENQLPFVVSYLSLEKNSSLGLENISNNVDIFGKDAKRYTPREWFIAPLEIVEQAIELIITGEIINYSYDEKNEELVLV